MFKDQKSVIEDSILISGWTMLWIMERNAVKDSFALYSVIFTGPACLEVSLDTSIYLERRIAQQNSISTCKNTVKDCFLS